MVVWVEIYTKYGWRDKLGINYIENIPIDSDYATPQKENKLRKYLLNEHIEAAKKFGISPVKNTIDIMFRQFAYNLKRGSKILEFLPV